MNVYLEKCQCVKIDHNGRNGKQGRVETIEHATVAWQYVAAVFDTESAFKQTLNEIAPCAEDNDDQP